MKTYNTKIAFILFFVMITFLSWAGNVLAVCPVCTVAVGAGVGLSRYLGIDDTIAGLWIGGLVVSMIMWTLNWLQKKNYIFKGKEILVSFIYYGLIIVPLFHMEIMGHPFNTMWGMDKLLLGIIIGSIFFFLGGVWYFYLKKKNSGHAYFPFQKVVMPIAPLIILSIFFYFLTK